MSFDQFAVRRRAPKRVAIRALAIGVTSALMVLFMPTAAFAIGPPDAPAKPTVVTGDASISVSFVAPADNGNAITGYTATCTSSTGGATGSNSGATSAITVSSLTNAATYTCTVHATNIDGNSGESAASDAVIAGAPGRPAQPTVTHGDGLISVAFVAPAANGSAIQFFNANCTSSDGGTAGASSDLASPVVVSGLDNGKTYTCTVSATNVRGTGVASVASASTVPATVPETTLKPTVARGNAQITVSFVAQGDNGSAITGFTATCTSSNGGITGAQSGSSSPLVVTGLTNGRTYTCTVHATNAEGSSPESGPSSSTVPATVPTTPAQPTIVHGNANITVTFTESTGNGGSLITGYTATCTSSNGGTAGSSTGTASPLVVSSLTNGRIYTCTVHGTNALGDSAESAASASTVPATIPAAPAQPTVTRGNTQISVAFVAPANNGSTITGYTAACTSSTGGVFGSRSGGTSPIVVDGLTNGNTYTCTVFATNAEGDSAPSAASVSTVPATLPSAPAQPTVTPGNALISVAFSAPANDGGSAITGYTASCTSSDGGAAGSNTGPGSPIVVSTLTNGKTYTCTVFATNATGGGDTSVASASTVPATVPGAPAPPTVTRGAAAISVAFVAPFNGGSVITGYTVSCSSSDGGASGSNGGTSSPIIVSALTNGKTYTCTVHATNTLGDGSESSASGAVVPAAVPDAPAAPTLTHGNAQISVAFVAPADNGNAITGYSTSCTSSDGGASGSNTGATSPIVVSSLTNGKTYTCTVLATNAVGNGLPSAASSSTVPATVPTAPAQPTVTHHNASIAVAFVAPANGGSVITGYTASCTSSNGGAGGINSGATSPITVTALTNGNIYTCTVHATNAEGNSGESVASASTVPATVPDAPAKPTTVAGVTSIAVTFVAPADGSSAITGYTAACTSSDGGSPGTQSGAASPLTVTGLSKGKTYTCTVHATNAEGNSGESPASNATGIPATQPDAPAPPTLTHGNALISVAFVAPADGGSAITGYTANCTSSDGGVSGTNTGATSPVVVSTLTNGKTYTCTVIATNAVNDSSPSPASASTIPATTPTAPAQPTVTHGNALISVAFVAPANGGSAITGYTATCTSSDGGTAGSNAGSASPIVVSILDNGKTYTCTVHATNAEGNSGESVASASTVPATVPNVPAQPTVTHGNALISVAFVAPANGGSAITGYTASCTSSDGGLAGSNTGGSTPIVVSSLTNGKTYTCVVHATNAEGSSTDSAASASTVPATTPGTPGAPALTHGNALISVAFVAPANGGSAITGYTATCTSSDGGAAGSNAGASSPIVVSSLTNGKTYTCVVHATNAEGSGSDSAASASTVPATVPTAPAPPTVTHGNALVSVAFVAPANGGSAITGYTASCISSDGGLAGSNTGGSTPIVVSSLTNGKTYTCVVHATNAEGSGSDSAASASTVPATVPDAPVAPTATLGNGQISVAFVAPANGGSAITGYTATCSSSDGGAAGNNAGASSPIVVSSLTNGKTYTCTVHATNAEGNSTESAASGTTVPATVPSAPAKPTTVAAATHITVSFVAPADGGSAITGYTASCTSSNGGASGSNTGASSPIAVPSLSKGKTYTCTVHATNAAGNSAESPASDATVVPATVADAPAQPTTTFGNGQISVAFIAPNDGGSAITGYSANCTSTDGGTPGSHSGGSSPIVVTGLDNGKTYTCTVLATNGVGDSDASIASDATVPATVPGTPAAPTVTRGNASISVAFVAPANGGSAITGYTASCSSSDGGISGSNSGATSPIVVSSLTNGKTYTCTVLATNVAGNGAASSASSSVVPATVPSAPAAPTLTHGSTQISVAFVAPANGGSAITGYTASCVSSDGGTSGSNSGAASPIVVSSLTNGKTYTCTVLATNALGSGSPSAASASTVPATVPTAPAAPTVTRGNASMSVAFVAPANGGSAITGYTASCSSSDGGISGSNSGAASPIVVASLTNGKTYTCTVHATNAEGNSIESAASSSAVPATVPTAPAKPTATPGATSISVAFVAPANGGSAITAYTASCVSSNGGTAGSNSGATSPIVVSSLSKGKSYTCTVLATNVIGNSSASPASDAALVPATVPNTPAASTLTHGDASISSAFVAPSDGGSAITGYTATCTSSNGGAAGDNSGASTPIVVSSLTNGSTYTCTVHATNVVGNSLESAASASTMPNVVPNAPAQPTVVAAPGRITVKFTAPSNSGTAITGYVARCRSSNGGAISHRSGPTSPIVVSSLTNGRRYTCTVQATNAEGTGAESVASASVQLGTMPRNTVRPTITGVPIAQRLLTAHKGTWTGTPAPTFRYRWQRCNRLVTRCVNIEGGRLATYGLTENDVDMRIRVVVSATNLAGTVVQGTLATRPVRTLPGSITGPYFYQRGQVKRAAANVVGTATHGSIIWTVTGVGNLTGPRFGPNGGTLVGTPLTMPIVGMKATPSGNGYWLFAGDGGVFTFGDARFFGSTGAMRLNSPIVAMETTPSGNGYWLFAGDGGVFTFGDARFHGSTGGYRLAFPAVAILATPTGRGYWIVTANGRALPFGDARPIGGVSRFGRTDIVGLVSTGSGFRFATKSLQLLAP